jgi:putative effector of murein hydrolase
MNSLSVCSGGDTDIPMIIPPTVKAEITDNMTMPKTAPMLITLFIIIWLLRIHSEQFTTYYFYKEKMIFLIKLSGKMKI